MGKREQNKVIIKARLLEEAKKFFSTKGFEATTVADIVAASEVGRGTFYNYFTDVKDIFDAVFDEINREIEKLVQEARAKAENVYEMLYNSFLTYFDYVSGEDLLDFHRKNETVVRSTAFRSDSIRKMINDLGHDLKSYEAIGQFEKKQEIQLLSMLLIGAPLELYLNIHLTELKLTNHEMAEFLAKLFTSGFGFGRS